MGMYSTLLFTPIAVFSLPIVRRRLFTLFYAAHFLALPAAIFAFLHAPSDFYYCIPGLGMYAVDLAIRIYRLAGAGGGVGGGRVVSVRKEGAGFVKMDVEMPGDWREGREVVGGMWCFVNVRGLSRLQWHPYSLAQSPTSDNLTILFKPNMTKPEQFEAQFANLLFANPDLRIAVDGPFGGLTFDPAEQDTVLCFAAGTGGGPAIGVLRRAAAQKTIVKCGLFWSVRDEGAEGVSLLQDALSESTNPIHIEVFHTGSSSADASPIIDLTEVHKITKPKIPDATASHVVKVVDSPANTQPSSTTNVLLSKSRMDPAAILTAHVPLAGDDSLTPHRVGIFICGPEKFVDGVRKHVVAFGNVAKGRVVVELHEEGFEL
ncbi:hypothetical protein HDV00_007578 [Rhizophlyctis rosea]|nr:hypothetical protein HDV00_007578 [Rhizophlyctis rosea]